MSATLQGAPPIRLAVSCSGSSTTRSITQCTLHTPAHTMSYAHNVRVTDACIVHCVMLRVVLLPLQLTASLIGGLKGNVLYPCFLLTKQFSKFLALFYKRKMQK